MKNAEKSDAKLFLSSAEKVLSKEFDSAQVEILDFSEKLFQERYFCFQVSATKNRARFTGIGVSHVHEIALSKAFSELFERQKSKTSILPGFPFCGSAFHLKKFVAKMYSFQECSERSRVTLAQVEDFEKSLVYKDCAINFLKSLELITPACTVYLCKHDRKTVVIQFTSAGAFGNGIGNVNNKHSFEHCILEAYRRWKVSLDTNTSQGLDLQTVLEMHTIPKSVEPFLNIEVKTLEMPLYFGWYSKSRVSFSCPFLANVITEKNLVFQNRFHAIFG